MAREYDIYEYTVTYSMAGVDRIFELDNPRDLVEWKKMRKNLPNKILYIEEMQAARQNSKI